MKMTLAMTLLLCLATACGGKKPAANAPSNMATTATGAEACPAGHVKIGTACEKTCQTDADCDAAKGDRCVETAEGDERDVNPDGSMGPVMEPIRICGIDH